MTGINVSERRFGFDHSFELRNNRLIGYAVKAHGLVERPSEDIDFATDTATRPIPLRRLRRLLLRCALLRRR